MTRISTCIITFYILLLSIFNSFGQQEQRGINTIVSETIVNNTYAIIIGISDYQNVRDLQFADLDARSFAAFLMAKTGGSIPASNITIILNEEATAINIGAALDRLAPKLVEKDRLILFFAGHGDIETANQNNGLLLLHKAPASSYFSFGDEYLKVSDIRNINHFCFQKNVEVIIITDACRSGHLAGGSAGLANTSLALSEKWASETKILSCQPNEISLEGSQWGGGHGVFTYYLVNGLFGLADQDNDSQVSLLELDSYLKSNVIRETSPALQTPFVLGDLRSTLSYVNKDELIAIKEQLDKSIPLMAWVNTKGTLEQLKSNPDTSIVILYEKYQQAINSGKLILPDGNSAYDLYQELEDKIEDEHVLNTLKRNLAASLQDKAMEIILPILKLEKFDRKPIEEYRLSALELDTAIELLGKSHYLSNALKIRSLFLEAYALCEEYDQLYADKVNRDSSNLVKANEKLIEANKIDSTAAYPYFQLGWIAIRQNDMDGAFYNFSRYTELVPNNKRVYNNLGYAYDCIDDTTNALYNYKKSIELDSNYAKPYANIGTLYGNAGNMGKAESYFKLSVQKDTLYAEGYFNLGLVSFFTNKYSDAKEFFEKVIELNPSDFDSYYYLAAIYSIENNKEKAIANLKKSLELGFDDYQELAQDSSFDNIRRSKEFKKLLKEH